MSPHAATIIGIAGDAAGMVRKFACSVPIGRGPQNTFCFPGDDTLHEQHTGIVLQHDDRWYVINSNPEAPTYVDDVRVQERFTLIPSGSVVRCGKQAFRVIYGDEAFDRDLHRSQVEELRASTRAAISELFP